MFYKLSPCYIRGWSNIIGNFSLFIPKIKDSEGRDTYELGKAWIGEEYTAMEYNEKKKKELPETRYRYFFDLIEQKFLTPAPVLWSTPGKKQVLAIDCGELHLLAVARTDGKPETEVYSAGHNQYGQLGHGDEIARHELTLVSVSGENL